MRVGGDRKVRAVPPLVTHRGFTGRQQFTGLFPLPYRARRRAQNLRGFTDFDERGSDTM